MKVYAREFLLRCSALPPSAQVPPHWEAISAEYPELVRKVRGPAQGYPSGDDGLEMYASAVNHAFNKTQYNPILDALRPELPKKTWDATSGQWVEAADLQLHSRA